MSQTSTMRFYTNFTGVAFPLPEGSISGSLLAKDETFVGGEVTPTLAEYIGDLEFVNTNLSNLNHLNDSLRRLSLTDCPITNQTVWPSCNKLTIANCPNLTHLTAGVNPHTTVDIALQPEITLAPDFKCKLLLLSSMSPFPPEMFKTVCLNNLELLIVMESSQNPTAPENKERYLRNSTLSVIAKDFQDSQDYLALIEALQPYPEYAALFLDAPTITQSLVPTL